jgi:hypothetical protein
MRKAERTMIAFIESKGYVVDFEREIWKEPRDGGPYIQYSHMLKGWTRGNAYYAQEIQEWRLGERKTPKPKPHMSVITYCSAHDAFGKARGRIIATARLLRLMGLTKEFKASYASAEGANGQEKGSVKVEGK